MDASHTCLSCFKSHVKCERSIPCKRCLRLGLKCVPNPRPRGRPKKGATSGEAVSPPSSSTLGSSAGNPSSFSLPSSTTSSSGGGGGRGDRTSAATNDNDNYNSGGNAYPPPPPPPPPPSHHPSSHSQYLPVGDMMRGPLDHSHAIFHPHPLHQYHHPPPPSLTHGGAYHSNGATAMGAGGGDGHKMSSGISHGGGGSSSLTRTYNEREHHCGEEEDGGGKRPQHYPPHLHPPHHQQHRHPLLYPQQPSPQDSRHELPPPPTASSFFPSLPPQMHDPKLLAAKPSAYPSKQQQQQHQQLPPPSLSTSAAALLLAQQYHPNPTPPPHHHGNAASLHPSPAPSSVTSSSSSSSSSSHHQQALPSPATAMTKTGSATTIPGMARGGGGGGGIRGEMDTSRRGGGIGDTDSSMRRGGGGGEVDVSRRAGGGGIVVGPADMIGAFPASSVNANGSAPGAAPPPRGGEMAIKMLGPFVNMLSAEEVAAERTRHLLTSWHLWSLETASTGGGMAGVERPSEDLKEVASLIGLTLPPSLRAWSEGRVTSADEVKQVQSFLDMCVDDDGSAICSAVYSGGKLQMTVNSRFAAMYMTMEELESTITRDRLRPEILWRRLLSPECSSAYDEALCQAYFKGQNLGGEACEIIKCVDRFGLEMPCFMRLRIFASSRGSITASVIFLLPLQLSRLVES